MIIITDYIVKHELKPLRNHFGIHDILEGAQKVIKNLAIEIKPPRKITGSRFYKVRVGKKGSGRMIVFFTIANQKVVPLLIRLKKDKLFGMNMSMNNPAVVNELKKNIDAVFKDISTGRFQEF